MEKHDIIEAVKQIRSQAKKRNFSQTFDLQIRIRDLDLKKPEAKIEVYAPLAHSRGRAVKVCALVGGALYNDAKENCDRAIGQDEFKSFVENKKDVKKLVREYDFFIAQADAMGAIATSFGKYLGPLGKMPSPKAGGVIPPKGSIKPIYERLQKTVKLQIKGEKCAVGVEAMKDEEIADNVLAVYSAFTNALPQHEMQVKDVLLKLTMSQAVKIGGSKK